MTFLATDEEDSSVLMAFLAVDVPDAAFLPTDDFAALDLRLEATDFLIAAWDRDFRDLAEANYYLVVPAVFAVATAFLLEALRFLPEELLIVLIMISESVLPNLSVF